MSLDGMKGAREKRNQLNKAVCPRKVIVKYIERRKYSEND